MSIGNIGHELQNGVFPAISTTPVKVINISDATYGSVCLFAYGNTVPNAVSGYAVGCLFIDTDAAADSQLWINEGTTASCTFNEFTTP